MRRINIFLLTGMVLFGLEIEGSVWEEGYTINHQLNFNTLKQP